jgi:hypothetical protein
MQFSQTPKLVIVTAVKNGSVDIIGDGEERHGLSIISPKGFYWLPSIGDRVLLIPYEGTYVCIGVLQSLAENEVD